MVSCVLEWLLSDCSKTCVWVGGRAGRRLAAERNSSSNDTVISSCMKCMSSPMPASTDMRYDQSIPASLATLEPARQNPE